MISIVIIIFGIFSAIGAFIAATSKIYDSSKRGIKKITYSGAWFILCAVVLILLPAFQNWLIEEAQKKDQDERDRAQKAAYDSSLLIMKKEFDSSNKTSTATITEILGKYGYKVDSLNEVLTTIRDNPGSAPAPVVQVSPLPGLPGILITDTNSKYYNVNVTLVTMDAGAAFFKIKSTIIVEDFSGKLFYVGQIRKPSHIPYNDRMAKDAFLSSSIKLFKPANIKRLYIWLRGNYKRTDGTGNFSIDDLNFVEPPAKKVGRENGQPRQNIIDFIKQRER